MPRKRSYSTPVLSRADLIRVADGIVDPNGEQVRFFRSFYQARFGVVLEPEDAAARLRHLARLYALLRGHERRRTLRRQTREKVSALLNC